MPGVRDGSSQADGQVCIACALRYVYGIATGVDAEYGTACTLAALPESECIDSLSEVAAVQ
jgi:hypothetical protein